MAVVEAQSQHQHLLDELIADVEAYKPDVDRDLLQRAFAFAERAHEGQQRRSGEDFIHHPWGAAKILAGLHLDEQTLAAALLRRRRGHGDAARRRQERVRRRDRAPRRRGHEADADPLREPRLGRGRLAQLPRPDRRQLLGPAAAARGRRPHLRRAHGANIVAYSGVVHYQLARNRYTAELGDVKSLRALLNALRQIYAVFDAYRVTPS